MWITLYNFRTAEDYEKIIAKAEKLEKYDFIWYIKK